MIRPEIQIDAVIEILKWSGKVTPTSRHSDYDHDKARKQLALFLERAMECPGTILVPCSPHQRTKTSPAIQIDAEAFTARLDEFMRKHGISPDGFWSNDYRREAIAHQRLINALRLEKSIFDSLDARQPQPSRSEDNCLTAQSKSRKSETAEQRETLAKSAIRSHEKDLTDKNLKTLIEQLPDAEAVAGDFKKFIVAMKDKQNRGVPIKKSEQELCEFIVGSIVPNLLKGSIAHKHESKPPGRS